MVHIAALFPFLACEVMGIFHDNGYLAEKEVPQPLGLKSSFDHRVVGLVKVFNTAFNLHLVGWLKAKVFCCQEIFYDVADPREAHVNVAMEFNT